MKKKVGIFTWCNRGINYGQTLQAYAVYKNLKNIGIDAKLIRYRKRIEEEPINKDLGNKWLNMLYEYSFDMYKAGTDFWKEKAKFLLFAMKNINSSNYCYDKNTVEREISDCDALVCGSDQIWNPASFDPIFFLDVGEIGLRRVAYAPSINDALDYEKKLHIYKRMEKLIQNIDFVSVREDVGVDIVKEISGITPVHVLDPTLLLRASDWGKVASKRLIKEPYMLCYVLGEIKQQEETVRRIAKEREIKKIVFVNVKNTKEYALTTTCMEPLHGIGPEDFLSLIKYSEVVFTDSFHGVAFSINFKKEFFAFKRYQMSTEYGGAARVNSILRLLHLEERCIDSNTITANMKKVDYSIVQPILEKERAKSINYLKKALE